MDKKLKTNSETVADIMTGKEDKPENKPEITLRSNEVSGIEEMEVDQEFKITLTLKCVGKNKIKPMAEVLTEGEGKPKDETAPEDKETGYDMVFEIMGSEVANDSSGQKTE